MFTGRASTNRPARRHGRLTHIRRAFSLIELLVVVAVLSLLISIALPAVYQARLLVRNAVCVANLRSIGLAWQLYLHNSDGVFPLWRKNMQWFYGGKHPAIANDMKEPFALKYRPLNPYVDLAIENSPGSDVFKCPADRDIRSSSGEPAVTRGHTTFDYFGNSYMMNWLLLMPINPETGWLDRTRCFKRSLVEVNSSLLAVAGDCQWYFTVNDAPWDAYFHNYDDRMGLVFLDGHAAFMQLGRGLDTTGEYTFSPYK